MERAVDGQCQEREEDEELRMGRIDCVGVCGICWECSKESCKYSLAFRVEKNGIGVIGG